MPRYLDLVLLVAALAVFVLADLPIAGYLGAAAGWIAQRGVQQLAAAWIAGGTNRQRALGIIGGSIVARLWLITLSVLVVGLAAGDDAGLAAAILSAALVTANLAGEALARLGNRERRS